MASEKYKQPKESCGSFIADVIEKVSTCAVVAGSSATPLDLLLPL
jgi:hypothetical protein